MNYANVLMVWYVCAYLYVCCRWWLAAQLLSVLVTLLSRFY